MQSLQPFARLHLADSQPFPAAAVFHTQLLASQQRIEAQRKASLHCPHILAAPLTLTRFRSAPSYAGGPAAAGMAFCVCAFAHGWTELDITAALTRDHLSRDANSARQAAYIRRTLSKVMRWAASQRRARFVRQADTWAASPCTLPAPPLPLPLAGRAAESSITLCTLSLSRDVKS